MKGHGLAVINGAKDPFEKGAILCVPAGTSHNLINIGDDPPRLFQRVTPALVLRELRTHNFGVLSTVDEDGRPRSAGVNYGVSAPGSDLAFYVMTRRHLQKARNIVREPSVALVVPLRRRFLWFLPPATIQLSGRAEILDRNDPAANEVFRGFWMGRRILDAYAESSRRGETRICFLKLTPDPVVRTYMVGYGIWELRSRMESGAAKVVIPASRSGPQPTLSGPGWSGLSRTRLS